MPQHTYGWKPQLPDFRDHQFKLTSPITNLPSLVDLRPHCPPVYDQGQLGSCTANAAAGAYEFDLLRQGLTDFTPSRLFIYYNERKLDGDIRQDAGSQLRTAAKTLNQTGVCDEKLWPYIEKKFKNKPTKKCFTAAVAHKTVSYQAIDNTNINLIKQCLASGSPIIFGFSVYESFESEQVAKTGLMPMPLRSEQLLGGHACMIVGYDDSKSYAIARNNWGADWGDKGYFYVPYQFLTNSNLASDFWQITSVSA